jgi:hypothetical protein
LFQEPCCVPWPYLRVRRQLNYPESQIFAALTSHERLERVCGLLYVWDRVPSNSRVICEELIGKDLEGSGSGLIEVLSQHLPYRTEKNIKSRQSGYRMSWPRFRTINFEHYCYTSMLDRDWKGQAWIRVDRRTVTLRNALVRAVWPRRIQKCWQMVGNHLDQLWRTFFFQRTTFQNLPLYSSHRM